MTLRSQVEERRLELIERRLNEIGSMVKGNQSFQADRISDVLTQVEEARVELAEVKAEFKSVSERVDRMAEFLNQLKKNGKNGT